MSNPCLGLPTAAADLRLPGYWKHETSGVLRPAITAYLQAAA